MWELWKKLGDNYNQIMVLCTIVGISWLIEPIKGFIKNLWNNISFCFKRLKFLFNDKLENNIKVANCLQDLNDCNIQINKNVIGDMDNKDYFISPMLLTIICNVIENKIGYELHCIGVKYTPKNYYDYLDYIKSGSRGKKTLDESQISALKKH